MIITATVSATSISTEEFLSCFAYAPRLALSLRFARIRRTCQVVIKATPKTIKPSRIIVTAISPPFQWKALLTAELVGAAAAEDEVAVVAVVEAVRVDVDFELDAVDEADVEVTVAVVVATTPLRSFVNESSARMETMHIANRKCSR
jgi:hypothetical protein